VRGLAGSVAEDQKADPDHSLWRPVAEIIPVSSVAPADWMGSMKDSMKILGDIVSPASEPDEWEVLREEV